MMNIQILKGNNSNEAAYNVINLLGRNLRILNDSFKFFRNSGFWRGLGEFRQHWIISARIVQQGTLNFRYSGDF